MWFSTLIVLLLSLFQVSSSFMMSVATIPVAKKHTGTVPAIAQSTRATPSSTALSFGVGSMEMRARVCDLLGKRANRQARRVTYSNKRNKRVQEVNLQWKRFYSDQLDRFVKLRLSTKGIKTVHRYGSIDSAARKFNLNLKDF